MEWVARLIDTDGYIYKMGWSAPPGGGLFIIVCAISALAILALCRRESAADKDGAWHQRDLRSMRRWTGARWEYRTMTTEEYREAQDRVAW